MRTVADLREALLACEQPPPPVEHFLANIPGVAVSDEISIVPTPVRRRRRPTLWITAAAVAAAVTTGSLVLVHGTSSPGHAPSGSEPPLQSDQTNLPFAIGSSTGVKIVDYDVSSEWANAQLVLGGRSLILYDYPTANVRLFEQNREPVDINGVQGEYAEELETLQTTPKADGAQSASASAQVWSMQVHWPAPNGRTIALDTGADGRPVKKSDLLAVARDVALSATTPVTAPFSLAAAPQGLPLVQITGKFERVPADGSAPVAGWGFGALYQGRRAGYSVSVSDRPDVEGPGTDGAIQTVTAGHPAYWTAKDHTLVVDLGGAYLAVAVSSFDGAPPTEQQVVAIAETVTVVPHPEDRSTWFDASEALPLGS